MTNVCKYLSKEQTRRQQILRATRFSRRNCARIKAQIRRQVPTSIQNLVVEEIYPPQQSNSSERQPIFPIPPQDIPLNMHVELPSSTIVVGASIVQEEPTNRCQNPFMERVMENCREMPFMDSSNESSDMEVEVDILEPIMFDIGNVNNIKEECLSIVRSFELRCSRRVSHPSTMALLVGDCSLHSMGDLSLKCHFCHANLWISETKKNAQRIVGTHCCAYGKVFLLPLHDPPTTLKDLLIGDDNESKEFRKNMRAYNSSLAFVSLGAHLDDQFCRGRGVYSFRIHGMTYHRVGALLPNEAEGVAPRFAQLYVYDTEHELENRLQGMPSLNHTVLEMLQRMMHTHNPYAHAFRSMREVLQTTPHVELRMVIKETRTTSKQYLVPTASEVAAIMPGQGDDFHVGERDIEIFLRNGQLKRISNLHRSYMPLLYVLLFPRGEDGWHIGIRHRHVNEDQFSEGTKTVTQREYYAFRLQIREDTKPCLLRGARLLQQYIVDAYSSIEESRLVWIRNNQTTLRSELYKGLTDMVNASDTTETILGGRVGRRIVLPSSFTGGPRYMHQLYQDSMAIVRKMGKPDLFITFTCNPKWVEIVDALLPGQSAGDRPDLTARVFYQKHKDMMHLLIKRALFGKVMGFVSVIEFQKRGLPHAHVLLILANAHKPREISHYNRLVCAELPDKIMFPELHSIISHCNVHGPCGPLNMQSPCMVERRCKYHYPRNFCETTALDDNGYPRYMRRNDGSSIQVKGTRLDNRWIVPYNPFLSMRYKAHINIEVCSTITAVKYLYKYVYKGHDRATIQLGDTDGTIDEISHYLDARYVSASEACWRIYEYDLHESKPDIQRLQIHLPMENSIVFNDNDDLRDVVTRERNQKTTLTEWFVANQLYEDANNLLYIDFPCKWVWNKGPRTWTRRVRGNTIGRMYNISPSAGEKYFLRMLLTVCKGCKSFEDLRKVDGHLCPSFKAACLARGLLESDEEWITCLQEATFQCSGSQLRQLFVVILVFCEPLCPGQLWERFSSELSEDFIHCLQTRCNDVSACLSLAKNQALLHVQDLLQQYGKQLANFLDMPLPHQSSNATLNNGLLMEELLFDPLQQSELACSMERTLNDSQRIAYDTILEAVCRNIGGAFFLDGPGGSGKTYLYNAILSRLRGENHIALACASSGIAALLLANGRTAHSRFKIPLVLNSSSTCNIKVNSPLAEVLKMAKLIIWDEAPMTHRHAFEALNRTLQDIMQNDRIFGGKVMLLGGDFRQVLPVIPKGSREDIVDATLCRSLLWSHVTILKLTQNMRVMQCNANQIEQEFVKWVLDIGNGNLQIANKEDVVKIPENMILGTSSLQGLIEWVYQDVQIVHNYAQFFKDRAILAPRNQEVDEINEIGLHLMPGEEKVYLSADSIASSPENSLLYTIEYLNNLNLGGGFPSHRLVLKKDSPIMLLRNLDPRRGLCNGTRLICKNFYTKVIEAEIITGTNIGDRVFIPRITFIPTSLELPFDMRRRQFPVRLAFGMTINKSQGQTLSVLGLYLATPVFTHGQLYVSMSRVRSSNAIKVYVKDDACYQSDNTLLKGVYTINVVYKDVLEMTS